MLQAIQFGTNLMHLHVSNLSDFKLLKYGAFVANDKVIDCVDTIKDLIKSYMFEAKLYGVDLNFKMRENSTGPSAVITDKERVLQVLQNVIRYAFRSSKRNTAIELEYWTEIQTEMKSGNALEGQLFFRITLSGYTLTPSELAFMFTEMNTKHEKACENLIFYTCKQICLAMHGDLTFEVDKLGNQTFLINVRCVDAHQVFDEHQLTTGLGRSYNSSSVNQTSESSFYSHRSPVNLTKILLVTKNAVDRVCLQFVLRNLCLNQQITSKMTPQDGLKHIVSEYQKNPSGDGYALVILDLENFQRVSVRQVVLDFKK